MNIVTDPKLREQNQKRGDDAEDKYKEWHLKTPLPCYACDVDIIEWYNDKPIAVIDLKAWPPYVKPGYWVRCEKEAKKQNAAKWHRILAQMLGVKAYHVFINWETGEVAMMELEQCKIYHIDIARYEKWLIDLSAR
jgi:hypothetical protein